MLDLTQFREFVVRPGLERLAPVIPWTLNAENLILGTFHTESKLTFVDQTTVGPGPAYGLGQMEEFTYEDHWKSFIPYVRGLRGKLLDMAGYDMEDHPPVEELHGNLFYAVAMCRVHYFRAPRRIPDAKDATGLAAYWKAYYNTPLGAGTIEKALPSFKLVTST